MRISLTGLFVVLVAINPLAGDTNPPSRTNITTIVVTNTSDAVEKEFKKLEAADDAAAAEVDQWIRDNLAFEAKGAGKPAAELNERIRARLEPVRQAYEEFIKRHPDHAPARLAYASFLEDTHDEDGALAQLERARDLDPKNPAVWNNLANHYGHTGKVKTAFEYYAKAIELNPNEPVYFQNFATTVYLFRKDAMEFYAIAEQQVFDKALDLYVKAFKLDPANFNLATDLAQTYYGIRPMRTEDALKAWTNAFAVAHDNLEREGVHVHFARLKSFAGRTNEARAHLNLVTNEMYAELKQRLTRNLDSAATKTNTAPPPIEKK